MNTRYRDGSVKICLLFSLGILLAGPMTTCAKTPQEKDQRRAERKLKKLRVSTNANEFVRLAKEGQVEALRLLIKAGANPNVKNYEGIPALMLAAMNNHAEAAQLLIDAGADVNSFFPTRRPGYQGIPIWEWPADVPYGYYEYRRNDPEFLKNWTPLTVAALLDYQEIVQVLLNARNIDLSVNNQGAWALTFAVDNNNVDIASALLYKNVNVNCAPNGDIHLHRAALLRHWEMVELLLDKGARIDPTCSGWSSGRRRSLMPYIFSSYLFHDLHGMQSHKRACENKSEEDKSNAYFKTMKALLEAGAYVHAKSENNKTALMFAAAEGNLEVVDLLLEAKASIVDYDDHGDTPLVYAFGADSFNILVVEKLIAPDLINNKDTYGETPPMGVFSLCDMPQKAMPHHKDPFPMEELVQKLETWGYDWGAVNKNGKTFLMLAESCQEISFTPSAIELIRKLSAKK
ncbi:MAG: ankyrin repeat domain-containing protein [Elusimicrobia bacterium]|nr:ankyrin repeat domain-containing protein [Elusimicrobiota bacterium]